MFKLTAKTENAKGVQATETWTNLTAKQVQAKREMLREMSPKGQTTEVKVDRV